MANYTHIKNGTKILVKYKNEDNSRSEYMIGQITNVFPCFDVNSSSIAGIWIDESSESFHSGKANIFKTDEIVPLEN